MNKNLYFFAAGFIFAILLFWLFRPQIGRYQAMADSHTVLVDTVKGTVRVYIPNRREWIDISQVTQ